MVHIYKTLEGLIKYTLKRIVHYIVSHLHVRVLCSHYSCVFKEHLRNQGRINKMLSEEVRRKSSSSNFTLYFKTTTNSGYQFGINLQVLYMVGYAIITEKKIQGRKRTQGSSHSGKW